MTEPCIRCGQRLAAEHAWPHCEACYQVMCNEVAEAAGAVVFEDAISRVMREHGIGFIEAVERLARERGLQ